MSDNFSELKERILARITQTCGEQYKRTYSSETAKELMEAVKDNFHWCVKNKVLTVSLIEEYRDLFTEHGIHCNESIDSGYLLADNATVEAWGNATEWLREILQFGLVKTLQFGLGTTLL